MVTLAMCSAMFGSFVIAALAQQQPAAPPPSVAKVEAPRIAIEFRAKPEHAFDGARVVSIAALPKMWTITQQRVEAGKESAFGRLLACVGDRDGDGRDELVAGTRVDEQVECVERFSDRLHGEVRGDDALSTICDVRISSLAVLRDPKSRRPVAYALGSGTDTGDGQTGWGCVRLCPASGPMADTFGATHAGPPNYFGEIVGDAGDLDGDGVPDVLCSYPAGSPAVSVYSSRSGKLLASCDASIALQPWRGGALAGGRDLDGDGALDVAIGMPDASAVAITTVAAEQRLATRVRLAHANPAALFGEALAIIDDIDGDKLPDLLIGAPWGGDNRRGEAFVVSGKSLAVVFAWRGERDFGTLGRCVCADSDLDGDGVVDFVVSAPGGTNNKVAGCVYVISGRDGRARLRIDDDAHESDNTWWPWRAAQCFPQSDAFGWAVASGDFDGDKLPDLAIGSPQHGPGNCVGKVYAISGAVLREAMSATSK